MLSTYLKKFPFPLSSLSTIPAFPRVQIRAGTRIVLYLFSL